VESKEKEVQPRESNEGDSSLSSSQVIEPGAPSSPPMSQSIFARLQQAIPPNIISTVQKNIPESLKQASEHIDIAHLKSEFQRVQGVTRAQAEEYVHKSEVLFREAMKEAGEVLKDVVKVVPPDQADNLPGVMWDGTDIWMLPTDYGRRPSEAKGKEKESTPSSARLAVASRAEALLRKLKSDPEIIAHDTEEGSEVKALFEEWLKENVDSKEGGMGGPEWKAKVEQALADPFDGSVLQATYDALGTLTLHPAFYCLLHQSLVPAKLDEEVFWKRYFFRVYQIEKAEERRRGLLEGSFCSFNSFMQLLQIFLETTGNDENFSWEDEDEDLAPPRSPQAAISTSETTARGDFAESPDLTPSMPAHDAEKPSASSSPVFLSPRQSSDESYDVLSSEIASTDGEGRKKTKASEEEEGDSDWE
jgi:hypothetical protein